jgi:hypothetical protein
MPANDGYNEIPYGMKTSSDHIQPCFTEETPFFGGVMIFLARTRSSESRNCKRIFYQSRSVRPFLACLVPKPFDRWRRHLDFAATGVGAVLRFR